MYNLYHEEIIEHARHPSHRGLCEHATHTKKGVNPGCGDEIMLSMEMSPDGVIKDVRFDGVGCALSVAACDMLAGAVIGKTREDVLRMSPRDVYDMLGVSVTPSRTNCALLGLRTLQTMLRE
jgi:nitrogen fixation NifU-like protein